MENTPNHDSLLLDLGCRVDVRRIVNAVCSAHHEVLKFATAPELRCPQCKHAMQCVAGETLMTLLPGLPKPTAGSDIVKRPTRKTGPSRRSRSCERCRIAKTFNFRITS